MAKVLIALGGNALGNTPSEQLEAVKVTAKTVVDLYRDGNQVVIVHGNGPQVGAINNAMSAGFKSGDIKEMFPFAECGAMSQGYIGYHIQNAIDNELARRKMEANVASIVTQTIVSKTDKAFKNPTKPIGAFMTKAEAQKLAKANGWTVKEDAGRGWRRVVPSPKPVDIKEKEVVKALIKNKVIVIAGGGGGVPVFKKGTKLIGTDAVIDKDSTAAKLAEEIKADAFIILTAVNQIKINFGKKNEESLKTASIAELKKHIKDEQFAPGSMLPKVEAVMNYVISAKKPAYIGELKDAAKIVAGKAGTKITK